MVWLLSHVQNVWSNSVYHRKNEQIRMCIGLRRYFCSYFNNRVTTHESGIYYSHFAQYFIDLQQIAFHRTKIRHFTRTIVCSKKSEVFSLPETIKWKPTCRAKPLSCREIGCAWDDPGSLLATFQGPCRWLKNLYLSCTINCATYGNVS